jgi:hypothetical protein
VSEEHFYEKWSPVRSAIFQKTTPPLRAGAEFDFEKFILEISRASFLTSNLDSRLVSLLPAGKEVR